MKTERHTHLFEDDGVDVGVEDGHEDAGPDDGDEVEEDEVVVVHDLTEEAQFLLVLLVPAHDRKEAH